MGTRRAEEKARVHSGDGTMTPLYRWRTGRGWTIRQAALYLSVLEIEYTEAEQDCRMNLRNCPVDTLPIYPF